LRTESVRNPRNFEISAVGTPGSGAVFTVELPRSTRQLPDAA